MKVKVYRGTKEIGGTLIEISTTSSRIMLDAGYPLFLNGHPIGDDIAGLPVEKLLELGVLPMIDGLYAWGTAGFDAVIISHAHLDHYGLLKYIHPQIPVYMSAGTKALIEISRTFNSGGELTPSTKIFKMYLPLQINELSIKPYLMDHSAFGAAAFEISAGDKTIIYTGDFRGHGRKAICLERFIESAPKHADLLLTEGTMLGRADEKILTEDELESEISTHIKECSGPLLFQSSAQNIDRLVSFFKASLRNKKTFVVDVYTANVLFELRKLGNHLPYPSDGFRSIKVFYPYQLTQKIFNKIGAEYAKRFSAFHISRKDLKGRQADVVMLVRPSMLNDIRNCELHDGLFAYSMWEGYRNSIRQHEFEQYLLEQGFRTKILHTSGHASVADIKKTISGLDPKKIAPIHTMVPSASSGLSDRILYMEDGVDYEI